MLNVKKEAIIKNKIFKHPEIKQRHNKTINMKLKTLRKYLYQNYNLNCDITEVANIINKYFKDDLYILENNGKKIININSIYYYQTINDEEKIIRINNVIDKKIKDIFINENKNTIRTKKIKKLVNKINNSYCFLIDYNYMKKLINDKLQYRFTNKKIIKRSRKKKSNKKLSSKKQTNKKNSFKQTCKNCLHYEECFNNKICEFYRPKPSYSIPKYWPKQMRYREEYNKREIN